MLSNPTKITPKSDHSNTSTNKIMNTISNSDEYNQQNSQEFEEKRKAETESSQISEELRRLFGSSCVNPSEPEEYGYFPNDLVIDNEINSENITSFYALIESICNVILTSNNEELQVKEVTDKGYDEYFDGINSIINKHEEDLSIEMIEKFLKSSHRYQEETINSIIDGVNFELEEDNTITIRQALEKCRDTEYYVLVSNKIKATITLLRSRQEKVSELLNEVKSKKTNHDNDRITPEFLQRINEILEVGEEYDIREIPMHAHYKPAVYQAIKESLEVLKSAVTIPLARTYCTQSFPDESHTTSDDFKTPTMRIG